MSREQDLDRNEQATPFKLEEARKRGQIARSTDAAGLAVLLAALMASYGLLSQTIQALAQFLSRHLQNSIELTNDATLVAGLAAETMRAALLAIAPLLLLVVVMAILMGLLQGRGLVLSIDPIKPDFSRLNPASGLKRLISMRVLFEAAKNMFKLAALAGTAAVTLWHLHPVAVRLVWLPASQLMTHLIRHTGDLLARLCAVFFVFVVIDLIFVRWQFLRSHRMSKREVEDEHKHREGDPRVRHRQREVRTQFLRAARAVRQVPTAQVVITNPTHVAVALRYEHGVTPAPLVIAKGAGLLAQLIRRSANRAQVPIVCSPRLARALYESVPHDAYVPEQWYPGVARILVWLRAREAWRTEVGAA